MKLTRLAGARAIIGWLLIVIIAIVLLARLLLPWSLQYGFTKWFEQHGIDAHITDVRLELYNGEMFFNGITGRLQDQDVFSIDNIGLSWSWAALREQTAQLTGLSISGLRTSASQLNAEQLQVAGLTLPLTADSADATEQQADDNSEQAATAWQALIEDLNFNDMELCYSSYRDDMLAYCVLFDTLQWSGSIRYDLAAQQDSIPLYVEGDFELTALQVANQKLQRDLLQLERLQLQAINVSTLDSIRIDTVTLQQLGLMQRAADDDVDHVTGLQQLTVKAIQLDGMQQLAIDSIDITDHQLLLHKLASGELALNEWLPAPSTPEDATVTETAAAGDNVFHYRLAKLNYNSSKSLHYRDSSLAKPFDVRLSDTRLEFGPLDSRQQDSNSQLKYAARYDEHGTISLEGTLTPLADRRSFDIDGVIRGLDLRNVSAFTSDTIGYSIKSGQLDSKLDLKADSNVLDSNIGLELHHLQLKPLSKEDQEKMQASMGFPLNTSLGLLKDRDNTIRLDIPVTGDLNKPDFDPASVINKAVSEAITIAVINYYTPYGLVMAADGLLSLATALRFDPVVYAPGSAELPADAAAQIDKISELMLQRPGVRVTLCGYSTAADAEIMFPDRKADKDGKLPALNSEQLSRVMLLAEQRAKAVKQQLVDKAVAADRMVLCAPEYDATGELNGVEISI